jgi:phosphopantetheinyl transferase
MTVSVAIMAEVAALLDPAQKVVRAKNVQAAKWIDVEKGGPRVSIVITAKRVDEQRVSVRITPDRPENQKGGLEILAESTIILAPDYAPAPNAEPFELVNAKEPNSTGPELYATRRMFHGPSFHGISDLDAMGDNGLLAKLDTLPRSSLLRSNPDPFFHVDPYLLDAAGQLVGYWPIEYCTEGFVLFPIRIEELILYREPLKPGVRSVCQMRLREISQRRLKADLDVVAPDGKLWMRVVGWEDWRFYWPREFYEFWRAPNTGEGARPLDIRKPEGFSDVVCRRVEPFGEMDKNMWENLWAHMILSRTELQEYRSLGDRAARARWMCERAVVKDAVCMWVRGKLGRNVYPADVEVSISNGETKLGGLWRCDFAVAINVSVANDGAVAIAAADTSKVGIEIESLVHWEAAWEARSFQPREREIVAGNINVDRDEWLSRSWCAKKAAGKTFGIQVDRGGELNQFVIEQVDVESGDIAVTRKTSNGIDHSQRLVVSTVRDGDYIIALAAREDHDAPR